MLPGFPDFSKVGEAAEILGARAASADASITEIRELLIEQNAFLAALVISGDAADVASPLYRLAEKAMQRPFPVGEGSG